MQVSRLDHLVLTVSNIERSVDFYQRVLGMRKIVFHGNRIALGFGEQKINLHQSGQEFEPKAGSVQVGSADLCFVIDASIAAAITQLNRLGVVVIDGPVERSGATGTLLSAYFRDPDQNLIEISNYCDK